MQSTNIPSKIPLPFGYAAGSSYINPIPAASQIGINDGRASLHDGFPPDTFTPVAAGGIPPFGGDFNGILNEITSITQWQEAGGFFVYDATFSTAVGGYPKGAILQSTSFDGLWTSSVENNTSNPDANGAGWTPTAFNNLKSIALSGSSVTLTQVQAAYPILIFTGTLTANCIVNIPAQVGKWIVVNRTTGSFTVQFKTSSGTGVYAPQGYAVYTYGDATNIYYVSSGFSTQEGYLTATQGQTVFPLTGFNYVPNTNNIAIFVNGSKQLSGVNFSETSSTAITFVSGLNVGDIVEFVIGASFGSPSMWASNVYYNEQGAGAVTRTLESKLQESVSVKDFGAVGDGITDDTTAIQAAINATPLYGILIFPQGNYNVSSTLNLPQSIGLVGGEVGSRGVQQATLKWTATGGTMFTVASGTTGIGTSFKGLRIVNNTTSDATLIAATATFGLVVEECLFSGLGLFTHAIVLKETSTGSNDGSFDSLIIHNTFANASVYVDSVSNDTKIIENQFFAEIANYAGAQLFASTTSSSGLNSLLISGNNFEGTLVNTAFAVDLTLVTGCVFENNRVEIYTGGTVKFTQMLGSCTVTGNFLNQPYVYSGSRATSAHNEGQQFTEFSNFIAQQTNNTFTEINNIQGVFSGKNLFDIGNINTDWYFGNCSHSYIENGSLGFRSPVLELLTPTSGTSSGLESSNMIQDPELQLAIANEAFTTTVFIVKAPSTNIATSVVTVYTGDALEYWTVPKDNKWHVIKVVRRMQIGDTVFQPTAYLAYASSYNAADKLYIAGIGVWVGTGAFELPFFNSFTQSPSAASNTGAWVTGEIVQNMAASTTGNPVGFVCTASGTPGTWNGYGALI